MTLVLPSIASAGLNLKKLAYAASVQKLRRQLVYINAIALSVQLPWPILSDEQAKSYNLLVLSSL